MSGALFRAIVEGDFDSALSLVERDREVLRSRHESGASPILFATYYGHVALAEEFAKRAGSLELAEAVALGRIDEVREALEAEPSRVNDRSGDGYPLLGLAVFFRQTNVADYLLDRGADVNSAAENVNRVAPIHAAVARKDVAMLEKLLARGADPSQRQAGGFTPLHGAASEGSADMVRALLDSGADGHARTDDGKTPAELADERGFGEIAATLRSDL